MSDIMPYKTFQGMHCTVPEILRRGSPRMLYNRISELKKKNKISKSDHFYVNPFQTFLFLLVLIYISMIK